MVSPRGAYTMTAAPAPRASPELLPGRRPVGEPPPAFRRTGPRRDRQPRQGRHHHSVLEWSGTTAAVTPCAVRSATASLGDHVLRDEPRDIVAAIRPIGRRVGRGTFARRASSTAAPRRAVELSTGYGNAGCQGGGHNRKSRDAGLGPRATLTVVEVPNCWITGRVPSLRVNSPICSAAPAWLTPRRRPRSPIAAGRVRARRRPRWLRRIQRPCRRGRCTKSCFGRKSRRRVTGAGRTLVGGYRW
jgi:hypothetical protein